MVPDWIIPAMRPEHEDGVSAARRIVVGRYGRVARAEAVLPAGLLYARQGTVEQGRDVLHRRVRTLLADHLVLLVGAEEPLEVQLPALVVEVADREHAGAYVVPEVAEHPAHVPLRLARLAPRDARKRESVRHLAWRAVLSLPEIRPRRQPCDDFAQPLDLCIARFRRNLVPVVYERVEEDDVVAHARQALLYERRVAVRKRQPGDDGVRHVPAHNPRRAHVEAGDVLLCLAHLADVRFVPH